MCLILGVQNIKSEFRKSLYGVLVITFYGIFTYIIVNNKKFYLSGLHGVTSEKVPVCVDVIFIHTFAVL
jgi:hypothetical protein